MNEDLGDLLPLFLREAGERLERLSQVASSGQLSADTARSARRELHALKGASRMMRLVEMSELCHSAEEELDPLTADSSAKLVEVVDRLVAMVNDLTHVELGEEDTRAPSEHASGPGPPPGADDKVGSGRGETESEFRVSSEVLAAMADRSARIKVLTVAAHHLGDRMFQLAQLAQWGVSEHQPEQVLATLATTLRQLALDYERIERKMQRLAEAQLERLISLQVQPLKPYLFELARHARELARSLGKEVDVQVSSGESHLDRRIIEALKETFLHLVRNAVDHGIDNPEERHEMGKESRAQLMLRAEMESDRVRIEVRDDGRGIDPHAVRSAVLAQQLMTRDEIERMDEGQILQLVCLPGFSTRPRADGISGRGVGMDAVAASVHEVGGELWISSQPGAGTAISVTVPVARRGEKVLVLSVGENQLALPAAVVKAFRRLTPEMRLADGDGEHLHMGGRLVAARVLSDRLAAGADGEAVVVETRVGVSELALVVDRVVGEEEVFLKPLPSHFGASGVFDSMAVIGSGRPIPVLSPARLGVIGAAETTYRHAFGSDIGIRVLLVDDSHVTREMIRRLLEDGGFAVSVAGGADEALSVLAERDFDCVVTDIEMPGMDGLQLTRRLREMSQFVHMPVIVVSTRDRPEDRLAGLEAGADAYLTKQGLSGRELVALVRRVGSRA